MRCEDVTRELAVPTGALDPAELAEHLTVCSRCADWGDRCRQFDRLWDATRPADPSPAAWQAVWGHVTRAAEPATVPFTIPPRWRHRLMVAMALAQAAVLMIAALAIFRSLPGRPGRDGRPAPIAVAHDVAQEGQTLFICLDDQGRRVDCDLRFNSPEMLYANAEEELNAGEDPIELAWDMEIINRMEGAE